MATVTPSAVAKLWRKDVPREARYAGLRDLLEEDASDKADAKADAAAAKKGGGAKHDRRDSNTSRGDGATGKGGTRPHTM